MKHIKLFNESKNYQNLYHSIWRNPKVDDIIHIMNNGIKFNKEREDTINKIKRGSYKFLKEDIYTICVSRIKGSYLVTFVLDGSAISNRYKIEPFNLLARRDITTSNLLKSQGTRNFIPNKINGGREIQISDLNTRWASEEKIISKKSEYLNPKYIKEVIIKKSTFDTNQDKVIQYFTESDIDRIIENNKYNIKIGIIN